MAKKLYNINLNDEEQQTLFEMTRKGKIKSRQMKRAMILLIMAALNVSRPCVERIRKRFVLDSLQKALNEDPRPDQRRKLDGRGEATLIATACSQVPEGHEHWTLRLLAGKMIELEVVDSISYETIRRTQKNEIKPWQKEMWCIPEASAEYVVYIEDVLDQYERPYDGSYSQVCFDEGQKQLVEETREGYPGKAGYQRRYDYEYKRDGVRNLNILYKPLFGKRSVRITERHTMVDFAQCMKWLVDELYPNAILIRVVMDNLGTHKPASLYEAFPPQEARRILKKMEFHFTPKHGSWLNMAEIELSVFSRKLKQHVPTETILENEVRAIVDERNGTHAIINWQFRTEDARIKLIHLYPSISG